MFPRRGESWTVTPGVAFVIADIVGVGKGGACFWYHTTWCRVRCGLGAMVLTGELPRIPGFQE